MGIGISRFYEKRTAEALRLADQARDPDVAAAHLKRAVMYAALSRDIGTAPARASIPDLDAYSFARPSVGI